MYFDEWKHFSPFQAVMFPIGIAVTVRGVVELTKRGDEEDELDLKSFVKDLAREVRTLKRAVDRLSSERGQSSRSVRKVNSERRGSSSRKRGGSGSSSRRSRSALKNSK